MPEIPVRVLDELQNTSLTSFSIKIEGVAIPLSLNILSIDIYQAINQISFCRVVLYDGDPSKQRFEMSEGRMFELGKELEIFIGYNRDETSLMKGIITKQKIKIKRGGGSLLYVEIRDQAFKMTLDRKSKYFKELSDTDLIKEVAQEYGIQVSSDLISNNNSEIVQYQVSDWDFIIGRIERLGGYGIFLDDELKIRKMSPNPNPDSTLTYGLNVFDADLEMEARTQVDSVVASSWDFINQELLSSEITDINSPNHGKPNGKKLSDVSKVSAFKLKHSGFLSQQELDNWAEAQMIKSRFAKIRGTVKFQGTAAINPGATVELKGFGERFNGMSFVTGVRHNIGDGNWTTTIQIGECMEWHLEKYPVNPTPGALFNPASNGLLIGVVTQLQEDPLGEHRILVRIPVIDNEDKGTWCRIILPDAGQNRGVIWYPEINDEVVVGFLNDDPNQPVILGMLHSSSKPSPIEADDENHLKGIVSRSDMRLLFNDNLKSITLSTPNGKSLLLDDDAGSIKVEDEHGNKITLSSDGIVIESSKDLVLKAISDIKLEANNIENKASINFKGEGRAGSSISSSGTTEIKGSLVNIN